jgi:Ras-related protein Rab-32
MTRVFYKEAIAAIVVFDISRNQTLESAKTWKKDIDDKVTLPNGELIPTFLLCNKCDLEREVQSEKLTKFCYDNGFIGWFATSAKDGIGIEDSKMNLVQLIMTIPYEAQVPEDTIVIDEDKSRFSLRPSCC